LLVLIFFIEIKIRSSKVFSTDAPVLWTSTQFCSFHVHGYTRIGDETRIRGDKLWPKDGVTIQITLWVLF
jgi:hypothetical protein